MSPVTNRRVLRIALPIVLANVTVPILGAVDTGVVGQLGQAAPIGAVGMGAVILASVYWIFGFLRMGTTGLVAQAHGAGDSAEGGAVLVRGLLVAGVAGFALVALQGPLVWAAFRIAPASVEVEALARGYLGIRIWGAPAAIAIYALTGWLIALERTRSVLALQLVMNGLNIVLDLWFVLGLGWGVQGVAVATLIAETAGLGLGLWLCRSALTQARGSARVRLLAATSLRRMLAVNRDIMIRSVILQGSFTTFVFLGAGLGDVTLAANQVLLQFLQITAYTLDGFAFSAEALVGQAVGARVPAEVRRASIITSGWGISGSLLLGASFFAGGPWLVDLMAKAPEVQAEARLYLPWLALLPVVSVMAWMFDGIFIGATLTREMRNTMFVSVAFYIVALTVLLPAFANHGLWAALFVLNGLRVATMALYYRRAEAAAAPR